MPVALGSAAPHRSQQMLCEAGILALFRGRRPSPPTHHRHQNSSAHTARSAPPGLCHIDAAGLARRPTPSAIAYIMLQGCSSSVSHLPSTAHTPTAVRVYDFTTHHNSTTSGITTNHAFCHAGGPRGFGDRRAHRFPNRSPPAQQ
ncbi:hypothetical protein CC85DRAFT_182845 [Cutaneotrichosporon oleaginosum]|uniref:Uncharacterized protein n=1 Tax=Cutaneotrichosporon oleaginosum TaxID=879819 RepID=A0A0J1AWI3_9TREE|nr:uncharacterized protein CC85DRAFT_182845 [Cutaneotrichosporon oleaginosum]KLT39654.1 hypothetical protein CC85DRAFT_182845 [Cutaneotrichosporon oleaginosum]TXT07039.1 hypothetical protein COLE_06370 [Cutaneotrichosporon oleaginosum]